MPVLHYLPTKSQQLLWLNYNKKEVLIDVTLYPFHLISFQLLLIILSTCQNLLNILLGVCLNNFSDRANWVASDLQSYSIASRFWKISLAVYSDLANPKKASVTYSIIIFLVIFSSRSHSLFGSSELYGLYYYYIIYTKIYINFCNTEYMRFPTN